MEIKGEKKVITNTKIYPCYFALYKLNIFKSRIFYFHNTKVAIIKCAIHKITIINICVCKISIDKGAFQKFNFIE